MVGIDEENLRELTIVLHDVGSVVWHNLPKIRNIVITNPQWLADVMAVIISYKALGVGGIIYWEEIQAALKIKYAPRYFLGNTLIY